MPQYLINLIDVLEKCEILFKIHSYGSIEKSKKSRKISPSNSNKNYIMV